MKKEKMREIQVVPRPNHNFRVNTACPQIARDCGPSKVVFIGSETLTTMDNSYLS